MPHHQFHFLNLNKLTGNKPEAILIKVDYLFELVKILLNTVFTRVELNYF